MRIVVPEMEGHSLETPDVEELTPSHFPTAAAERLLEETEGGSVPLNGTPTIQVCMRPGRSCDRSTYAPAPPPPPKQCVHGSRGQCLTCKM